MKYSKQYVAVFAIGILGMVVSSCGSQPATEKSGSPATAGSSASPAVGFSVNNMDTTVDPRKDFYRYAAGGWVDRTEIPPDKPAVMASSPLLNTLEQRLLKIAKDAAAESGKTTGDRQKIGDFYASAMNTQRLDELGLKPIEADLAAVDAADSPAAFANLAAKFQLRLGGSPLFGVSVEPDKLKNDVNALYLDTRASERGLELGRHEYLTEGAQKIRDLYVAFLAQLFERAGDTPDVAKKRADTVLAIEKQLVADTMTPEQRNDPKATYNKRSLTELKATLPAMDLDAYFSALGVKAPESVIVAEPNAVKSLQRALKERPASDVRTLFRAYLLRRKTAYLGSRFSDPYREFSRVKNGIPASPPREKEVIDKTGLLLGHPLSRLYVEAYFPESNRAAIREMVDRIKPEFKTRIETNPWLSERTRATALEKLAKLQVFIGFPDTPDKWIDHSSVQISPGDYIGNAQRIIEFTQRRNLDKLGKPVSRDQFAVAGLSTPISMNAGLYAEYVVIEVCAAIAQPPYYVPSQDAAVNYGAMGAVIGHEMTHAFDSKGREYDVSGNLRNWWTQQDAAEFKKRSDLLVKQYDGYEVLPGLKANGRLTLSENIADLGGVTFAYHALQNLMKEKGRLPDVDGLSPEKRFFISWAQVWMTKARPEITKLLVATDVHSPSEIRAFGPSVNIPEFYETFGIKPGDPMWKAPEDRVRIW